MGDTARRVRGFRLVFAARWLATLAAMLLVISGLVTLPAMVASADSTGSFGAIPSGLPIQSRCQGMTVGGHVYFSGQEISAHTTGGICGSAPKDVNWSWTVSGPGTKGCGQNATYCDFKAGASTDLQYTTICINGSNVQGAWTSCDYYGVVGDGQGVIEGVIKDKDGGPVAGTTIKAYGHPGATTSSNFDGSYAMVVDSGSYQVSPEGGPQGKSGPSYTPKVTGVTVSNGNKSKADFVLDTTMELKLTFDRTTVLANGLSVANGTVTTTQYGKPLPNVQVQLEIDPSSPYDQAVSGGVRSSICSNGGRVWPTGSINTASGAPLVITTDATGTYNFSVTFGTTPGMWTLDAWAYNSNGKLSTDVTAASDTEGVTVTAANAKATLGGFAGELDTAAKGTLISTALASAATSASNMVNLLSGATTTGGINFGGLDFALANAKDGQTMIIFPEGKPPTVNGAGDITDSPDNANDLVYDPAEWTGAGLPAVIKNPSDLATVVSSGQLVGLPTIAQFDSGVQIHGWKSVKGDVLTLFSGNFEYLGWAYPSSTAGVCY
jgi:hypothetical protein